MASMMSMSMPMDHTTAAATPANKPLPTGGSAAAAAAAAAASNQGNIGGSIVGAGAGVLGGGIGSGIGIGGGPGIGGGIGSGIGSGIGGGAGIIGVGGGSNSSFHGGGGFPSAAAGDGPGGQQPPPALPGQAKRAEIYTYDAPWPIYGMNWSVRRDKRFRLAVGSFIEDYRNRVEIVQLDDHTGEFRSGPRFSFDHPFPCTKIMFVPDREGTRPDLIATSGDYLRIWQIFHEAHGGVRMRTILNNNRNSEFCAPLTSFDWNESEPRRLGTSSIDTTCTIWDIEREIVDTQLIAHDKEVYDIAWGGIGVFASVSADGSVRVFDLRDKEHSTIIYESPQPETPLLRLAWNRQDPRYMATILMDSAKVVVLDIRFPTLPVAELQRHHASVNAIAWAPHSSCHICTAGDDAQALIWDLSSMAQPAEGGIDPILAYTAGAEINSLQWSASQPEWVAIAFANRMQILRV